MQALYDDPELAAAAAAAAEKMDEGKSIPKRSRTVSEYPDHLRAMMDEGVPIKQWIILLVLLGAGLYQLRKVLVVGSSNNAKNKKLEKGSKAEKPSRKGGKQKGKRKSSSSSSSFVKARSSAPVVVKSAPKVEVSLVEEVPVAAAAAPKKAIKNKKKARNRQKNKPPAIAVETKKEETDALSHESPDSISTDGSSSTTGVEEQAAISPMSNKVESVIVEAIDENDGWQTVGAPVVETKAASKAVAKQVPVAANSPAQVPDVIEEMELAVEPTNGKEVAAPTSGEQASKPGKKKKGKKKAASEETPGDTATDDEALAKQLQLQEEKIAEHEATKAQEDDVWEEVTIKKKKKRP